MIDDHQLNCWLEFFYCWGYCIVYRMHVAVCNVLVHRKKITVSFMPFSNFSSFNNHQQSTEATQSIKHATCMMIRAFHSDNYNHSDSDSDSSINDHFIEEQQDIKKKNETPTASKPKYILHLDIDCFYCQCEEILNPPLAKKPLAIGQKHIIVTANYVARKLGIKKLMGRDEAFRICPALTIVDGSDLEKYRKAYSFIV